MNPLSTSYRAILKISFPIMLGSAAQNLIALIDSVFLYHLSEVDFAAIGFVGVFYLTVAAVGYGFSKGGQIIIARRMGEKNYSEIGRSFRAMFLFEMILATAMFAFMHFGSDWFFSLMVDSKIIHQKSLEYIEHRSWGVFFSYSGVAFIALYTGVARPIFIIWDTVILAIVNTFFCYGLIFGHFGMPKMGIAGAGLASSIAEAFAFFVFVVYVFWDKKAKPYDLFKMGKVNWGLIKLQYQLSLPIIAQMVVGLGSWFIFFSIVENLGERELAITNLVRMVYLILSIPTWGFASGVNTLVSGFIGMKKRQAVFPITLKTAKASMLTTLVISLPVVLFPQQILYPLLGKTDMSLIADAQPIFFVLLGILMTFSIGGVFFNGVAGTGATWFGLKLQSVAVLLYLVYVYVVVEILELSLAWAWAAEIVYWGFILGVMVYYLKNGKWHYLRV